MEENFELLRKIDATLTAVEGVTLAETSMIFRRYEQWFYSTEGAAIHQTRTTTGAGFAAHAFEGDTIQTRSYPNSFGGQYQNKGYELVGELRLLENAERVARECVALLKAPQCPEGRRDWCWIRRNWACRFMSRSGIRLSWTGCWAMRRTLRALRS